MKLSRLIATGLISLSALGAWAQDISFGIIATDSASAQRERWEPFFRDMEKKDRPENPVFLCPRLRRSDRSHAI
jgi:phosphonate transport system substrate-binding protein